MFDDTDFTAVASDMARLTAAAEAAGLVAVARVALRRREEGSRRHLSQEECDSYTADEIGALLRLSRPAARGRLVLALDLLLHRPATLAALTRGAICAARARRISEALVVLDHAVAAGVEAEALRRAPEQTPAQLTARLTQLVLRAERRGRAATHRGRGPRAPLLDQGPARRHGPAAGPRSDGGGGGGVRADRHRRPLAGRRGADGPGQAGRERDG